MATIDVALVVAQRVDADAGRLGGGGAAHVAEMQRSLDAINFKIDLYRECTSTQGACP